MSKGNFLLSDEWKTMFVSLPDAEAGQLIKAAFCYHSGDEVQIDDPVIAAIFQMIKEKIDADERKRNARCGNNHWNWKGGITDERHAIRQSADYKRFRAAVMKRDNYTCQICGQQGGALNVHHIKKFCDYPELRTDTKNGITLCKDCHKKVHKNER